MATEPLTLAQAGYCGPDDPAVIADPDLGHRFVFLGHITLDEANRRITADPALAPHSTATAVTHEWRIFDRHAPDCGAEIITECAPGCDCAGADACACGPFIDCDCGQGGWPEWYWRACGAEAPHAVPLTFAEWAWHTPSNPDVAG